MRDVPVGIALVMALIIAGCSKTDNPVSSGQQVPVSLSVAFSKSGAVQGLMKSAGAFGADSLIIDSAIVVFQRIKFESHIDSVFIDSSENDSSEVEIEHEDELEVTFRGPFVVHIRDTVAIDFASQTLPPGTYDGIKFKIHRLKSGEHHEDSDEHNNRPHSMVDIPYESSIVVWGSILKDGTWTPFEFKFNGEFEFKIKGNFVVDEAVSSINIALNFDMGQWFVNPEDGTLLDPTDLNSATRELFMRAIKKSFHQGRGGRDHDHDGHADDDGDDHGGEPDHD